MISPKLLVCVLLISVVLLSSCTPVSSDLLQNVPQTNIDSGEVSPPPDSTEEKPDRTGFRNLIIPAQFGYVIWNNMAFSREYVTDLSTGEVFSLCSNPLCGEKHDELCAINIMHNYRFFAVCPDEGSNDMIIYASNREIRSVNGVVEAVDSLRRYNFSTGKQEILLDNLKLQGTAWRMDPETKIIYYMAYEVNEEDESELGLYTLDTVTGESCRLGVTPDLVVPMAVVGEYVYAFAKYGTCCRFIPDEDSFELEMLPYMGYVYNGYLYIEERKEMLQCPVPDEMLPYCEKYNAQTYGSFFNVDLYRLDLIKENSEPELLIENAYRTAINSNYFCYSTLAPTYRGSYLKHYGSFGAELYRYDDPACPPNATLVHAFSPNDGTVHVLRADTMEPIATVSTDKYDIEEMVSGVYTSGIVVDLYDYSIESILSGDNHFKAYIPFNKPVLTEEDAVRIQLD